MGVRLRRRVGRIWVYSHRAAGVGVEGPVLVCARRCDMLIVDCRYVWCVVCGM